MDDLLREILTRADAPAASTYDADEVERWPAGALERLQKLGLLREAQSATGVVCRECDEGCWIEPELCDDPATGQPVGVYLCRRNDQVGRFTVDLARLRRWELDPEGLAAAASKALKLRTPPAELVGGRAFFLGTLTADGRASEVFFFRGLTWPDGGDIVARSDRFAGAAKPLVLVPAKIPPLAFWSGHRPVSVCLAEEATLTGKGIKLDLADHLATTADGEEWITVTAAAELLAKDFNTSVEKVKGRVSINATRRKFRTNGKKGDARRIELNSFNTWRLAQRDKDLDAQDW